MTITYEQICKHAYEIWEQEGRPENCAGSHWLRAEEELRQAGLKKQKGRKLKSKDPAMLNTRNL
ncbi:MAG: DUF2934 domain-containing protein [Verrucomicrobiota bacterium]|nr:DUF2934 domain-containing protein [Verrucomicrobiota bacterium]